MRFPVTLAAALALAPVAAWAQADPTVASFLARANAVREKGFFAMLVSSEGRKLQAEARRASATFKAQKHAREKAGLPPISCPEGEKLSPTAFLDELNKMPAAQRGMPLAEGMAWVSRRRFPCRPG
jgi:hypothetical protein